MAAIYKQLGQDQLIATVGNNVYTVPDGKAATISAIVVCNRAASAANVLVHSIRGEDGAPSINNQIYELAFTGKDTFKEPLNGTLSNADQLYFESDASTVSVTIYGIEFDQENVYAP